MKTIYLLILLLGFTQLSVAQKNVVKYTNQTVDLRTGPGAYYDFVSRVFTNAQVSILSKEENWLQVKTGEYTGWLPESSLQDQPTGTKNEKSALDKMGDAFEELSADSEKDATKMTASKAEVAAAVKGFARKYKTQKGIPSNLSLSPIFDNRINWEAYKRFRKSRIGDSQWYDRKINLRLNLKDAPKHDPTLDQTGFAIASVVAANGLYEDYALKEYVNYMALFIVESSHRYETPVQVHILNTNEVLGFAVPGGYIFISKGALKLMENEAELAHFLGHEIAHLTFEHGMQEYKKQRPRIRSSSAFDELDLELANEDSTKYTAVDQELSDWADEVYEYISQPRLEKYELDADYWGMVYAYRAGYAPDQAIGYLTRLKNSGTNFEKVRGKMEWEGTSLDKRIQNLRQSLRKMNQSGGNINIGQFKNMKNRIR